MNRTNEPLGASRHLSSSSAQPVGADADLRAMVHALESGLLERDTASRLVLLAAVAAEHVLLIGPPGTAKSELARRLQSIIEPLSGAQHQACFERLLTRFSTPEELFGPLSLKALEEDRYERLVHGYLPTAQVAFLDEVFKANSAILNALLSLLNERVFDNGTARVTVPLVSVVAASNETPTDEALHAFHDRFLIRVPVRPVSDQAFDALLGPAPGVDAPHTPRLGSTLRDAIVQASEAVVISARALDALRSLRVFLRDQAATGAPSSSPPTSDRRWRQLARLLRIAAAAEGRSTVEPVDLWLAAFVAPGDTGDAAAVLRWWQQQVLTVGDGDAPGWRRHTEAFEKQLEIESHAQAEEGADAAGKMALARSIGGTDNPGASGEMLRLYSARVEEHLRKRWSPLHVRSRTAQVRELAEVVQAAVHEDGQVLASLETQMMGRLWLPPSLVDDTLAPLRERVRLLEDLHHRLQACEAGFAALPVDEALSDVPVPMVARLSA